MLANLPMMTAISQPATHEDKGDLENEDDASGVSVIDDQKEKKLISPNLSCVQN